MPERTVRLTAGFAVSAGSHHKGVQRWPRADLKIFKRGRTEAPAWRLTYRRRSTNLKPRFYPTWATT
jgi:hypothetical protein